VLAWRAGLARRAAVPLALAGLNVLTFLIVAQRSGPLEQRYLLVAAGTVMVFAGYAIVAAKPRVVGIVLALLCIAYAPIDIRRLDDLHDQVRVSNAVYSDLREKLEDCDFSGRVQVPDVRLRPQVAYWAEVAPANVDTKPARRAVTAVGPVATELSSRSLPGNADTPLGAPPFWRLSGCARQ
jgi:hypothetical protein